jgi:CheY-like chemotaxis protein
MPANTKATKTLLVIDDDRDIRDIFKFALESEGYEVVTAVNGEDGLDKLRNGQKASLVLLDMMMPVMNGQQFLKAYLSDESVNGAPVLVISATADVQSAKGASGLLRKPIDLGLLLRSVAKHSRCKPPLH